MNTKSVLLLFCCVLWACADDDPTDPMDAGPKDANSMDAAGGVCSTLATAVPGACREWERQVARRDEREAAKPEIAPKRITYNALGSDALMFNSLTRNPKANITLSALSLRELLNSGNAGPSYMDLQLLDPFSVRFMEYAVGCALDADTDVSWENFINQTTVTWNGELGLCPEWETDPLSEQCQELISACVLARNNAFGEEVLVSLRGRKPINGGDFLAIAPGEQVLGGEPCDVNSFYVDCPGSLSQRLPDSNCRGWQSDFIGSCVAGQDIKVGIEVTDCKDNVMVRVCDGIHGCDHAAPNEHVASIEIRCLEGVSSETVPLTCTEKQAFTVMQAPETIGGDHSTLAVQILDGDGQYPAPEDELFPWQEGAFYGNIFCQPGDKCDDLTSVDERYLPVDFSLMVQVVESETGDGYEVQYGPPRGEGRTVYPIINEGDELFMRQRGHGEFLKTGYDYDGVVFQRMYTCSSPVWNAADALAKERVCAGSDGATYCAAHHTGRCWSTDQSTKCQCSIDDTSTVVGDMDFSECKDDIVGDVWDNALTVFLNDPCDMVPEFLVDEQICPEVPLCRQTIPTLTDEFKPRY